MEYKTLYNKMIDYLLFATNTGAGYRDFIKINNLNDDNATRKLFISAYKKVLYLLSH